MIGIDGTEFSQKKIWDTGFAVRVSRDTRESQFGCPVTADVLGVIFEQSFLLPDGTKIQVREKVHVI